MEDGDSLSGVDLYTHSNNTATNIRLSSHNKVQEAYQQLTSLNKVLAANKQQQSEEQVPNTSYENELPYPSAPSMDAAQLQRLENLNQLSSQTDEPDSEMLRLNTMLDKVLDIQHPERWENKEGTKGNSNDSVRALKAQPYAKAASIGSLLVSSLADSSAGNRSAITVGFYGLSNPSFEDNSISNMQAVIDKDQEIVSGATVQLMLTSAIAINGILIPKNSYVFGKASLQGERLEINIPSIRYLNKIFPVRLSVYDLDGLKGIYIPGTINREGSKQGADRAIQSIGLSSLNPSVSAQAAAAGIETAKSLLSKKVKLVRVELKAGYQVLLFDENKK